MAATEERTDRSPRFRRIPPGPQRLDRATVRRNQRLRICGAMAAAVTDEDYQAISISRVAGLAGVSRRAFYEQFANKDACLDAIVEELAGELVRRVVKGAGSPDAAPAERLCGVLEAALGLFSQRKELLCLLIEAMHATAASRTRCRALIDELAQVIASLLGYALPPLLARGVVHGAAAALIGALRDCDSSDKEGLPAEISAWILALHSNLPAGSKPAPMPAWDPASSENVQNEHERIMLAALRAALESHADSRTAIVIADHADISPERVLQLYPEVPTCFEAAREYLRAQILEVVAAAADCPRGEDRLRPALAALVGYLRSKRGRDSRALVTGEEPAQREFSSMLALTLVGAAGVTALEPALSQALAGAVWSMTHSRSCRSKDHQALVVEQLVHVVLATVSAAATVDEHCREPIAVAVCA